MATIVLTAVGTALGGPFGGAIGALVGRQVDSEFLFRPKGREGPRLQDLAVQTSQYGSQVPRIYGRLRVAGTVIWATDLVERSERQGGGKGRPSSTTYLYSVSFAVALSSRPVREVRRIWAEGNLLRGSAGDFKSQTGFRFHTGHGDQPVDPLIASAEGVQNCPGYRGYAYAVFEDMDLADFGNRIPSLTFEIVADDGSVSLAHIIDDILPAGPPALAALAVTGFAAEGGSVGAVLGTIASTVPLMADTTEDGIAIREIAPEPDAQQPISLDRADLAVDSQQPATTPLEFRRGGEAQMPRQVSMRYYEPDRDYQAGLRRSRVLTGGRGTEQVELAAAMATGTAQSVVEKLASRRRARQGQARVRLAALPPGMRPGAIVALPDTLGQWRVAEWEWRGSGLELELETYPGSAAPTAAAGNPGRATSVPDLVAGTTVLHLIDLPAPANRVAEAPLVAAIAGSAQPGWRGAGLLAPDGMGGLFETGQAVRLQSAFGMAVNILGSAPSTLTDWRNTLRVELSNASASLENASLEQLANGANLASIGKEIVQFARAEPLGDSIWELRGLWRGRGGTEHEIAQHGALEVFALLDSTAITVDPAFVPTAGPMELFALGSGDSDPVRAEIPAPISAVRPWTPVHLAHRWRVDGALELCWVRRSRAGHGWRDGVDVPLAEENEAYSVQVSVGDHFESYATSTPTLHFDVPLLDTLRGLGGELAVAVRQQGSHALSLPRMATIPI